MKSKKNDGCNDLIDQRFSEYGQAITDDLIKSDFYYNDQEITERPIDRRDAIYTDLILNYSDEYRKRRKQIKLMRTVMFWLMIGLLLCVVVSCTILFYILILKSVVNVGDIVAIITVCVTFLSSLFTIPIIMAKSLFPEKEDNQIIEVLTKLIENDDNIRKTNH